MDDTKYHYGCAGIAVLWPIVNNKSYQEALTQAEDGGSPNNISPILKYSLEGGVTAIWMGDLETTFMNEIEDCISLPEVDILFAPHHGRSSGRPPKSWMEAMNPGLVVIGEADSDVLDYYEGYTHICQNSAGDMVFECVEGSVHVFADHYYYGLQLPLQMDVGDKYGLMYVGSIKTKD
jgi:hypothetical protein